jgi:hypothetical protein
MTVVPNPFSIALDLLFPEPNPYLHDPVGWVRDVMGEVLWSGQAKRDVHRLSFDVRGRDSLDDLGPSLCVLLP